MNDTNTKICCKCKIEKNISEFGKHSIMKDGLRTVCKLCNNSASREYAILNKDSVAAASAEYRLNNKEKIAEQNKIYREKNKEKIAARKKIYHQNNADYICEKSREWRINNLERANENSKQWRINNPEKRKLICRKWSINNREKVNELAHRRRARKYENGIFEIREKFLKKLYASPCVICGSIDKIEADHIIPIAKGGRHSEGNLQPLCSKCNRNKSDKYMMEWKMTVGSRAWERENLAFVEEGK